MPVRHDAVSVSLLTHDADFYERFGFRSLSTAQRTLMVTLAELREAGYAR
jgi:predicted N-acetyltransferase YhbS